MVCETRLKPGQSISQRATEVRTAAEKFDRALAAGRIKVIIDKATGAIAFDGWDVKERDGITDGCIYRRVQANSGRL